MTGVATGDMGVTRTGEPGPAYQRGMALMGKYVLIAEGARGSLAKELIRRFALDEGREPGKFGIGLKELWEVEPAQPQARARAAFLRLAARHEDRRRLVPLSFRREPRLRRLRRAPELREPLSLALRGIPALQDARCDPRHVRGRAAHLLRRARHHRGRLAERAAARLPGRRADRLRGRLRQRAAHQGQPQRHAVRACSPPSTSPPRLAKGGRRTCWRATRRPGAARRSART